MHRPVLSSQFAHAPWLGTHPAAVWRRPAARALHALAVHMRRLARRLVVTAPARAAGLVSLPELEFLSPASVDLITYMGVKAKDGTMDAPAIKR